MSNALPTTVIGTTRIRPEARAGFGAFLDGVAAAGRGTLLTDGSSWVWETLRAGQRRGGWDVWAVVPNVAVYVREATDYGMFGAGWRRLRRMNPLSWLRLGFQGLFNARGVLRRDFPTLLGLLLELEMANFRRFRPAVVFLHPQMTDLLLAMDHGQALAKALRRIRRGFGAEPGLATNNLGTLLPRLQAWGQEVPYLLTPIHPRGYGMRASRGACETALGRYHGQVVAAVETPLDDGVAAYWQEQKVAAAVYDADEPSLTEWRRWMAWPTVEKRKPVGEPSDADLVAAGAE
jgi:hypothetical protein